MIWHREKTLEIKRRVLRNEKCLSDAYWRSAFAKRIAYHMKKCFQNQRTVDFFRYRSDADIYLHVAYPTLSLVDIYEEYRHRG